MLKKVIVLVHFFIFIIAIIEAQEKEEPHSETSSSNLKYSKNSYLKLLDSEDNKKRNETVNDEEKSNSTTELAKESPHYPDSVAKSNESEITVTIVEHDSAETHTRSGEGSHAEVPKNESDYDDETLRKSKGINFEPNSDSSEATDNVSNLDDKILESNLEDTKDSEEVSIPNRRRLNNDVVIDLKARIGHRPTENVSKTKHVPNDPVNMKSGYINPDYYEENVNPSAEDKHFGAPALYRQNPTFTENPIAQYFHPGNVRSGTFLNHFPHPYQSLHPPLFNRLNSKELFHSSNEIIGQGNIPGRSNKQFQTLYGTLPFSNQNFANQFHPGSRERCLACQNGRGFHLENIISRRAIQTNTLQTGDGRSIELEALGSNAYPYVPLEDGTPQDILPAASDNVSGHLRTLSKEEQLHNHQTSVVAAKNQDQIIPFVIQKPNPFMTTRRFGFSGFPVNIG